VFGIEPRVLVDNDSSRKFTLIEVKGPDRPGLLHGLTQVLAGAGLHIVSARIGTFGTGAVDTFYVRCREGGKLVDEVAQNALSEQLQQVLSPA
jgi:[protein-PII] uridylyltransferase